MDGSLPLELLERKQIAPIELRAVRNEDVDLIGRVSLYDHPVGTTPGCVTAHDHDLAVANSPLALGANQAWPEIKDQVVALVVERLRDPDAEQDRPPHDCILGNQPLLICRQLEQHT
jgi:hypothetical protein